MFYKLLKKYKFYRMFSNENIVSHSVVIADGHINNQLIATQHQQNVPIQIQAQGLAFQDFANNMIINSTLQQNNINETATPFLSQIGGIERIFKSPNFTFRSEIMRFGIWQTGSFENLSCIKLFKTLMGYDNTGIIRNRIIAIGINYEHNLNITDAEANTMFLRLLSSSAHSINGRNLEGGALNLSYRLNNHCLMNIEISKNQSNIWSIAFNANNQINESNTLELILNYDFYSEYIALAQSLCSEA